LATVSGEPYNKLMAVIIADQASDPGDINVSVKLVD
jgi:hypothetical protein